MNPKVLDMLVCPVCKGRLIKKEDNSELLCLADRLAFPVSQGIPVMLEYEARSLAEDEEVSSR